VLDNLPVDLVRSLGAETVIAVNVGLMPDQMDESRTSATTSHWPAFIQTAITAVTVLTRAHTLVKLEMDEPDLLIHPHLPSNIGTFSSFTRAKEIIEVGERAAIDALSASNRHFMAAHIPSPAESASQTIA
jgi:predicted acylesterase/phospholipase RssA